MKKLVERRNSRFIQAVSEVLQATPPGEDAVALLVAAARNHIPINPRMKGKGKEISQVDLQPVPEPHERPTINDVLKELEGEEWYADQVTYRRTFDARDGRIGIKISVQTLIILP
jgi:DEAD/DEAH box helicase domain-containing protein